MFDFPSPATEGLTFSPSGGPQYVFINGAWRMQGSVPLAVTAQTRSRIVNGAFQIAQEQTTTTVNQGYFADQWQLVFNGGAATASRLDALQTNGLTTYGIITVNTAVPSLAASNYLAFTQPIEGIRVRDWGWGAAAAKPVVLSFLTNCSMAGTFYVSLRSNLSDAAYVSPFTISAGEVSTWVSKTISIPGPTIGVWTVDTARSLNLFVCVASGATLTAPSANQWVVGNYFSGPGATNGFATASATFRIANVGLYLDPQNTGIAPAFQMPDEAEELRACQRYWEIITSYANFFSGNVTTGVGYYTLGYWGVEKRVAPTVTATGGNQGSFPTTNTFIGASSTFREVRTANATGNGAFFYSSGVIGNARM